MDEYDGRQIVGIDLHRRRSVIVRMTEVGERLRVARIDNDPVALGVEIGVAWHTVPRLGTSASASASRARSSPGQTHR